MGLDELKKEFNSDKSLLSLDQSLIDSFIVEIKHLLMFDYHFPSFKDSDLDNQYKKVSKLLDYILKEVNDLNYDTKERFLSNLGEIRKSLNTSIDAIFDGDPAAISRQQIALDYPGFEAILYYRVAHELYKLSIPLVARYISEYTHKRTGIDINPGAEIGDHFFIDHGTGIVIGETAVVGSYVKLYQGVTLGALSLAKGHSLKGTKRHPTVKDHVTIYSNAAIFGGDTVIGEHSTIGGDVYLTHSIEPYSIVTQTDKFLSIKRKNK